jgi:hypothetical protein
MSENEDCVNRPYTRSIVQFRTRENDSLVGRYVKRHPMSKPSLNAMVGPEFCKIRDGSGRISLDPAPV